MTAGDSLAFAGGGFGLRWRITLRFIRPTDAEQPGSDAQSEAAHTLVLGRPGAKLSVKRHALSARRG